MKLYGYDVDGGSLFKAEPKVKPVTFYEPTEEAIRINVDRIKLRIQEKPDLYPDKDRFLFYYENA